MEAGVVDLGANMYSCHWERQLLRVDDELAQWKYILVDVGRGVGDYDYALVLLFVSDSEGGEYA